MKDILKEHDKMYARYALREEIVEEIVVQHDQNPKHTAKSVICRTGNI